MRNVVDRKFERRLAGLINSGERGVLRGGRKGVEKESLRVSPDGDIVQTRHPAALGAPLTNEHITTDFSESLIELVTPPFGETWELLQYLCDIHQFVYRHLDDELLWATSMPCAIEGDASIPLAQFGTSNVGRMKTIYRHGLGVRYGRIMQAISGVHFNYSFSPTSVGRARGHQSIEAAAPGFRVRAVLRRAAQLPALRLAGAVPVRHLAGGVEELLCRPRNHSAVARRAIRSTSRTAPRCA